ncbi:MAG: long-chain fatty acid--CoA ligase [Bacillota bacterium]|nr:long-chain fatty acid--CoA ligase [Bacillota bacterium]
MQKKWPEEMTKSISSVFQAQVKKYGDRTMLMEKTNGVYEPKSWREVADAVIKLSQGLNSLGIKPKDRVALMMTTQGNWAISDLAILASGAINVPIYPTNKGTQIAHILIDSASEIIIVGSSEILHEVIEIWPQVPTLRVVIAPNGSKNELNDKQLATKEKQVLEWDEALQIGHKFHQENSRLFEERWSAVTKDDLASIIYTSGTTGKPKGVMLSHNNFLSNVRAGTEHVDIKDSYVSLSFLPLSHVLERTAGYYMPLVCGCTIAYAEDVLTVPQNLQEVQPHMMVSVPRLYEKIYNKVVEGVNQAGGLKKKLFFWAKEISRVNANILANNQSPKGFFKLKLAIADALVLKKIRNIMGGRLVFCISGGAPLGKELAEFYNGCGIRVLEGYGLTETSPVISYNSLEHCRYGSVGRPAPEVEVKIAEDGEILTKGPQVCQGYYNNQEATNALFDEDGWLKTGDIGHLDDDSYLFITDRKKDLIITSGGKNVAPQPIEGLLTSDRYIEQAVIYGDKRNYLVAMVAPNFEQLKIFAKDNNISETDEYLLITNEKVKRLLAKRVAKALHDLPNFEQIKRIYIKDSEFTMDANELTPTLKVRRRFIYQKYAEIWNSLYDDNGDFIEVKYKFAPQIATGVNERQSM